ncbi:PREDICTED: ribosomal protein L18-like [Odobenus rosmarus divergens]|uniref:Ribosomal protein L18-like n=1 Tax=Odobenus rosmarus divergens TaxID=9708 RepID=A0A9B0H3C6_ODORO
MKLPGRDDKTAVVVGTVTEDTACPRGAKLYLCALRVHGHAQRRILKGGEEILALDQLALDSPQGLWCRPDLRSHPLKGREMYRHLGKVS